MLGIGRRRVKLDVAACGKHPAFSDYIRVNTDLPMVSALTSWVDAGMKSGGVNLKKAGGIHSFRFWARGANKKTLIAGIVKDSSDSLGRMYPLLITIQVPMHDFHRQWHGIFDRFGEVFRGFEEMTAARYDRFKEFETALSDVRVSDTGQGISGVLSTFSGCLAAWFLKDVDNTGLILPMPAFLEKYRFHAPDNLVQGGNRSRAEPPRSLFIGGLPEKPVIAIFQRPLRTSDFCRLFDLAENASVT